MRSHGVRAVASLKEAEGHQLGRRCTGVGVVGVFPPGSLGVANGGGALSASASSGREKIWGLNLER